MISFVTLTKPSFPKVPSSENMTNKLAKMELKEMQEGELDAAHELERVLKFDVLDSVFQDWSIQAMHDPKAILAGKRFETYTHDGIPYRSSTSSFSDKDGLWSKIKLASNNFEYYSLAAGRTATLADMNGPWLRMNDHYLQLLPHVHHYARNWCGNRFRMLALYNRARRLTLVKCKGAVNLVIVFEDREPYTETEDMYSTT